MEDGTDSSNQVVGEVCIKRGIYQGDSLSPLLFVLALIPLTPVLRNVKAGYNLGNGLPTINLYGSSMEKAKTRLIHCCSLSE